MANRNEIKKPLLNYRAVFLGYFLNVNLNTISSGSGQVQSAPGAGQPVNTSFDINIVNPYLTINYIIRAGVGATQLV